MHIEIREMQPSEANIVVRYFHDASAEYLKTLGVDPALLSSEDEMLSRITHQHELADPDKAVFLVLWCVDGNAIGFSTLDKIRFGQEAFMHLHIVNEGLRGNGIGSECVIQSSRLYYARFQLQKLYCEPNAFNVAPNRTLQKAGFKYLKTYETVPGAINFYQAVNRWLLER